MMNKKGQVITFTVGVLIVLAIIVALLFGGTTLLIYILSQNALRIAGIALIVFLGLNFLIGKFAIPNKVLLIMLGIATSLIVLPSLGSAFDIPLSSVLP